MSTINYANTNLDQTVRIFDNFYRYDVQVPAAEYDVVYSYFKSTMKNERAAGNFTVSVFQVAQETNVPPLTLLQNFQGVSGIQLNATLAYYLNQVRSRATLLGVGAPVVPNTYAARNVLQ
jgi:aconitase B